MIEQLSALDVPVIDRATCERMFAVGRRRAIDLMRSFGGYQAGNTLLLDRLGAIARLQEMLDSGEVTREHRRKERLSRRLDELQRCRTAAAVVIPVSKEAWYRRLPQMPAGASFTNGTLVVEYSGTEQLLQRLFELAQAAANDYDSFRGTAEAGLHAREPVASDRIGPSI